MSYSKVHRRYPVAVLQGTGDVPDDGKYHVVVGDSIVLSTAVLDYALLTFEEQVEAQRIAAGHPDPAVLRAKERAHKDVRAMRAAGIAERGKRNQGGGAGGRGGV
jgi:hypothetical protein